MDNNQNQTPMGQNITPDQAQMPQAGIPTQPAQSITQQPQVQSPQSPVPQKSSHIVRTLLIMIILAVVVILAVFIYISFANKSNNTESIQVQNNTTTQTPKLSPTPASIEEEVKGVDVGNVDDDLKDVDTDLQSL